MIELKRICFDEHTDVHAGEILHFIFLTLSSYIHNFEKVHTYILCANNILSACGISASLMYIGMYNICLIICPLTTCMLLSVLFYTLHVVIHFCNITVVNMHNNFTYKYQPL